MLGLIEENRPSAKSSCSLAPPSRCKLLASKPYKLHLAYLSKSTTQLLLDSFDRQTSAFNVTLYESVTQTFSS